MWGFDLEEELTIGDYILAILCVVVSMLWVTKGFGGVLVAALLTAYILIYIRARHQNWWRK